MRFVVVVFREVEKKFEHLRDHIFRGILFQQGFFGQGLLLGRNKSRIDIFIS